MSSYLGVEATPGQIVYGSFPVDNVHVPLIVAAGESDGPTLVVHCAQHATEYSGSAMIGQLLDGLDLAAQRGTLVILPLCNMVYVTRTRLPEAYARQDATNGPLKGTVQENINRCWPGRADSDTWNDRLTHLLTTQLFAPADAVLDYHSCRMCDPHFTAYVKGDAAARELALAFGFEAIDEAPPVGHFPGQLHRDGAAASGTPTILIEMGPTGLKTKWRDRLDALRGAHNAMKHLGMIDGQPERPPRQVVFHRLSEQYTLTAGQMGFATFCRPEVDAVKAGDVIVQIRSLRDFSVLEEHRAPCDGGLASCGPVESHLVLPGEELATIQPGAEVIAN